MRYAHFHLKNFSIIMTTKFFIAVGRYEVYQSHTPRLHDHRLQRPSTVYTLFAYEVYVSPKNRLIFVVETSEGTTSPRGGFLLLK